MIGATAPFMWLIVLVSPAIGSFLAVLIDRLPRGEDVVRQPSACRTCQVRLRPLHMVPLVSFMLQRGRCQACDTVIPPWVFYVELLCLGAGVLAVLRGGDPLNVVLSAIFLWLLVALAIGDLLWFRLFDLLTGALAVVAFALAISPQGIGLADAIWGAVLGAGSFWALRLAYAAIRHREGLGLGDVKLMLGLGAFSGPYDLPLVVLIGALAALGGVMIQRLRHGGALAADRPLPFGAALCAAGGVLWLIGPQLAPSVW